jgi:hypothetical protein
MALLFNLCRSIGGFLLAANDQRNPVFVAVICNPVLALVYEFEYIAAFSSQLNAFKAKRLIVSAGNLHGDFAVMLGMPAMVNVRRDKAVCRHFSNEHSAERLSPGKCLRCIDQWHYGGYFLHYWVPY